MNWRDVRVLYLKELRSAVRERTIVVNGVLLPVFLYPVLLWLLFSGLTFVQGVVEGFNSNVAIVGAVEPRLLEALEDVDGITVVEGFTSQGAAETAVANGSLDAAVVLLPPEEDGAALVDNFRVRLLYDRAEGRSRSAEERLDALLTRVRREWISDEGAALAMPQEEQLQFTIIRRNVASDRDLGTALMAQMVPLFLAVMVALGCLIPAVDATAGERERSTWETTLGLATKRINLVTAKYLYVATVGIVAGLLNVLALFVSIGAVVRPLLDAQGADFSFGFAPLALPVMAVGAVGLALFFAAAMMVLAAFARTFKDGQAMVAPVYWLLFIPLLLGDQSGQHLTPVMAAIPIANVTAMMRDAIQGIFVWPLIAEVIVIGTVTIVVVLALARWILSHEEFLVGTHEGGLWTFARKKLS